jgi:hypothetical protein
MALTDNGTLLIPGEGGLYILQPRAGVAPIVGRSLIITVISVCTVALVLGIVVAFWFARRKRRQLYFAHFDKARSDGHSGGGAAEYDALVTSLNDDAGGGGGGGGLATLLYDRAQGEDGAGYESPESLSGVPPGTEYLF